MNLKCSPHILWLQETDHILLTHTQAQHSWLLRGERAFVWDMLCQQYDVRQLLELFAGIYPDHDAPIFFQELVLEWRDAGILLAEENGRG